MAIPHLMRRIGIAADSGLPMAEVAAVAACEALRDIPAEVAMILEGFDRVLDLGSRGMAAYAQA